jgi:hypothetical protein
LLPVLQGKQLNKKRREGKPVKYIFCQKLSRKTHVDARFSELLEN